ncbi:MAG: methyltransferase family protein [Candidatus Bathyarchaeia archaeon]
MAQFSEESVILFISWVWALSEIIGSYIVPRLRQKGKVKARSDRGSGLVIWLGIFAAIFLSDYFATNNIAPIPEFFFYVGIVLMVAGIVFRQWAIWVLGRFFSTRVRIVSDHRIVMEGPYRFLRHPSYTGVLMILLGLGLASRTWLGTIIILALFSLVIGYRMKVEENALKAEFGQEYLEYAKKTKRLFPFLF